MELITGDELASALAEQYGYRVIENFARHTYARKLLDLIPVDVVISPLSTKTSPNNFFFTIMTPDGGQISRIIYGAHCNSNAGTNPDRIT